MICYCVQLGVNGTHARFQAYSHYKYCTSKISDTSHTKNIYYYSVYISGQLGYDILTSRNKNKLVDQVFSAWINVSIFVQKCTKDE